MEPFKEVELIKELKALGTGSRAEMSKTALEPSWEIILQTCKKWVPQALHACSIQRAIYKETRFDLKNKKRWTLKINILTNIRFNSDSQITQSCGGHLRRIDIIQKCKWNETLLWKGQWITLETCWWMQGSLDPPMYLRASGLASPALSQSSWGCPLSANVVRNFRTG